MEDKKTKNNFNVKYYTKLKKKRNNWEKYFLAFPFGCALFVNILSHVFIGKEEKENFFLFVGKKMKRIFHKIFITTTTTNRKFEKKIVYHLHLSLVIDVLFIFIYKEEIQFSSFRIKWILGYSTEKPKLKFFIPYPF